MDDKGDCREEKQEAKSQQHGVGDIPSLELEVVVARGDARSLKNGK
jgi:hypothetical protein